MSSGLGGLCLEFSVPDFVLCVPNCDWKRVKNRRIVFQHVNQLLRHCTILLLLFGSRPMLSALV
jgi:hypothetical protein